MSHEQSSTEKRSTNYVPNPDEAMWVAQARQGDQVAFTKIVEAYQRPIYNLCYRMLGNTTEAEDAAQETFIRAYMKFDSYDTGRKFSSWLFSIGSHYCIDRLRRRRIRFVSLEELLPWRWLPSDDAPQPEEAMLAGEEAEELRALLNTLAPDYRAAVILKYWYNMAYEDIAETLDTTVSAIKSKLFRARKMMAKAAQQRQGMASTPGDVVLAGG